MSVDRIIQYIKTSKTLHQLKQTHTICLKFFGKIHYQYNYLLGRLLIQLIRHSGSNVCYGRHLFEQIPNCRNQFLWTSFIRYHVLRDHCKDSISLYGEMHRKGILPSEYTFSVVLTACSRIQANYEGQQIHSRIVKSGFMGNNFVQTAILDMYAKCGLLLDARNVFNGIVDKDVVAWTAMIRAYTKMGMMVDARLLFDSMKGFNAVSWTTMVAGYANSGDMKAAKELYDSMDEKTDVACLAMIAGYGKCGDVSSARRVFDEPEIADATCWAAMLTCYSQNGYAKEAMELYRQMRAAKVKITEVAMVGAISACTQIGAVEIAYELAEHVNESFRDRTLFISNSLIHMHSKCGSIDLAQLEFNTMSKRDVITYSTMIAAAAENGKTKEALQLFWKMQNEGIQPNQVTFVGLLHACSFAGLIEEGCWLFKLMTKAFGIKPLPEHYACMIDLLGRAGQIQMAYNLIMENVGGADAVTWGCLLKACQIYGNVELAEVSARQLFQIEPENTGNYVFLANTYAAINKWDDARKLRMMLIQKGIRKPPGCSWIKIDESIKKEHIPS